MAVILGIPIIFAVFIVSGVLSAECDDENELDINQPFIFPELKTF